MTVPNTPDLLDDTISEYPETISRSTPQSSTPSNTSNDSSESPASKFWSSVGGLVVFLLIFALKFGLHFPGAGARPPRPPRVQPVFKPNLQNQQPLSPVKIDLTAPIEIPKDFPKLGPPREIVPGILHYEISLHPGARVDFLPPGHAGKLWLYVPEEAARTPKSLGCVLLVPSESNFISGAKLSPADRVEHIPYVKAGFAVLAFEIDDTSRSPAQRRVMPSLEFLRSRAGLINGRIAIEFLKARVPEIDPDRLYVAGHYAAGTFALLLAEHEPTIRACLAYAPVVDLIDRLHKNGFEQLLARDGYAELFRYFSPKSRESDLNCPVFLFNARDNARVDADETIDFGRQLTAMGKKVKVEIVDQGGDVQSMHATGIPDGIKWLTNIDRQITTNKK